MFAYILAGAISIGFLLISILIANMIKYQGGSHPKDKRKRRIWFWIMGVLSVITTLCIGFFVILPDIISPALHLKATMAISIGAGAGFVLYIILGLILSKIFRNSKLGHWF